MQTRFVCLFMVAAALIVPAESNALPLVDVDRPSKPAPEAVAIAYRFAGQQYCYYPSAWRGPGWYVCGARWSSGYGWGGVYGWNGWGASPRVPSRETPSRDFNGSTSAGRFWPPAF